MVNGPNEYLYCLDDPVNWVDPLGLCEEKPKVGFSICPRYGNWGGLDWSGGTQVNAGEIGPNIGAIDQMDALFKQHDISSYIVVNMPDSPYKTQYRTRVDAALFRGLRVLPEDPSKWIPPARNVEKARNYRTNAEWWFGDVLGYRYD
jgi:hypothetical protein